MSLLDWANSGAPVSDLNFALQPQPQPISLDGSGISYNPLEVNTQGLGKIPAVRDAQGFYKRDYTPAEIALLQRQKLQEFADSRGLDTEGRPLLGTRGTTKAGGASMGDLTDTQMFPQSDTDQVRHQLTATGGVGAQILQENSPKALDNGGRPTMINGQMDYTGINPIKTPEDLLGNKTFQTLANQDPHRAAVIYKELLGKDFQTDYSEKEKQRLAMESDYMNGIRDQIIQGKMRRHPTQGWLERKVMIEDPLKIKPPTESWEPVDENMLQADQDFGRKALGYNRPNTVVDQVPMAGRNVFMQEYYNQQNQGKDDKSALNAALDKVQATFPQSMPQGMPRNDAQPAPTPTAAKANPPPDDPAEYQQYMTAQAQQSNAKVGNFFSNTLPKAALSFQDATMGNAARAATVLGHNLAGSINNMGNRVNLMTGNPLSPWMRPMPLGDITNPDTPDLPSWLKSGAWRQSVPAQ